MPDNEPQEFTVDLRTVGGFGKLRLQLLRSLAVDQVGIGIEQ